MESATSELPSTDPAWRPDPVAFAKAVAEMQAKSGEDKPAAALSGIKENHHYCIDDEGDDSVSGCRVKRHPSGLLWLTDVWTKPTHRGKGLVRRLVAYAVSQWNHEDLYLEVHPYTNEAMSVEALSTFYGAFGFVATDVPCVMRRTADGEVA